MRNKRSNLFVLLAAAALLGACDSVSAFIAGKSSPDEFSVYSRAPLSIPPEYRLRPPSPGAPRPQAVNPRDNAARAITGEQQTTASQQALVSQARSGAQSGSTARQVGQSTGEQALVKVIGGDKTDPEIRAIINRESVVPLEGSKSIADKLIFWGVGGKKIDIVDPQKENERIRDQKKKGEPITGDQVPTISRNIDRGFLGNWFD